MKIVIQCASSKAPGAGSLRTQQDTPVTFCANPRLAGQSGHFAHPDDLAAPGKTWRFLLEEYNAQTSDSGNNPWNLMPAGTLYSPIAYSRLRAAVDEFFVLSAGWGLVRSTYLLPDYNVTFSKNPSVPIQNRRKFAQGHWSDFNHLASDVPTDEEVHFFGSKDYLPLFYSLAQPKQRKGSLLVHHKGPIDRIEGCRYQAYSGSTRTNWHYVAISEFLAKL